jgi:hypothetical protein
MTTTQRLNAIIKQADKQGVKLRRISKGKSYSDELILENPEALVPILNTVALVCLTESWLGDKLKVPQVPRTQVNTVTKRTLAGWSSQEISRRQHAVIDGAPKTVCGIEVDHLMARTLSPGFDTDAIFKCKRCSNSVRKANGIKPHQRFVATTTIPASDVRREP